MEGFSDKFAVFELKIQTLQFNFLCSVIRANYKDYKGYAMAQLVEALHYKPEGCGFDSRGCHWIFSLT